MTAARRSSDDTKERILDAARRRFTDVGFAKATIRSIASEADIDPAMVIRYFSTKERLFSLALPIDLEVPDFAALPPDGLGEAVVRHFVLVWEDNSTLIALLRTAASDEEITEKIRDVFTHQVQPAVRRAGMAAHEVSLRAGLIASQILGLALTRYILRLPPVVEMGTEDMVAAYGPTIQRYLTGEVTTGGAENSGSSDHRPMSTT
ncbi:TetR family transcriptional regulator [Haloglycomyces albus]|uniref:TetR/AcrR family transcriptional regulator n=1 Tax=Haloglycomyces albus TaxID=526067 RepID=UPI00046CA703|nr:TetR family transcriptional regulator [Haloglycomyces albus]